MSAINFEEGEKVIRVVRRHWIVVLPTFITMLILALAPTILYQLFTSNLLPFEQSFIAAVVSFFDGWKVFGYSTWLLLLWTILFIEWTGYYLDLWIITDKRIIDVDQKGFFYREVTSFNYAQIQDITVETRGVLETFLKFGTLHIQTAGHNRNIVINDADHPEDARSLILKLQEQSRATQSL